MKSKKRSLLTPTRVAAWTTSFSLIVGALLMIWLYQDSYYQPLLLLCLLQLLPAALSLLLYLPILKKRQSEPAESAEQSMPLPAAESGEAVADEEQTAEKKKMSQTLKELGRRAGVWLYDFWVEQRSLMLAVLSLSVILGFGIYYVQTYAEPATPGLLAYVIPVAIAVVFVAYIVLDKWCKHTAANVHEATEGEEQSEAQGAAIYDRAVLNSLRGALSVARLALVCAAAIIMLRMLGLVYWDSALGVIVTVLFFYQTIFMIISLAVRLIRREMGSSPELSIPMPGLGGEDLGILTYLEKNTGITMRSLWSIRLVGKIVPYAAVSIVLLLWGFSGMVKIESNQQGAHYRFGVLQEEALEPGLHMTLPWPFDSVEVYDTKVVKQVTIGYASDEDVDNIWTETHGTEEYRLLLGGGKELVSINMRIEFVIENLHDYLACTSAPESLMQAAAYELITEKTIGTDLATLLTADRVTFLKEFETELVKRAKEYGTGLGIVSVVLESIHPPVEVADIYQEIVNTKIEAQQIITTALGEASVTIIRANSTKAATVQDALMKKIIDIAAANAAVAELKGDIAADNEHGEAYRYYLYLNAIRKAYSGGNIILIGDGVNKDNIYIGSLGGN